MSAYENFLENQRIKTNALLNGESDYKNFPTYTYTKIYPAKQVDAAKLLKKNNELITKYLPKFKEAYKKENSEAELLNLLTEFSYDRDSLFNEDLVPFAQEINTTNPTTEITTTENLQYKPEKTTDATKEKSTTVSTVDTSLLSRNKEFNRNESLTFEETDKESAWCRQHTKKYHAKQDAAKFKKNPFYGGASPVSRFITVFEYCSLGPWAECRCQECYKKYEQEKEKLETITESKEYKKQKKLVDKLYNQAQFTIRDIDE